MLRREVFYSGNVQGVGFRFRTNSIAERYAVTGFVQNLDDGRVQLVAEGEADELDRFLDDVARTLQRYIRAVAVNSAPASQQFQDFSIQR